MPASLGGVVEGGGGELVARPPRAAKSKGRQSGWQIRNFTRKNVNFAPKYSIIKIK
jgi:hypothetical protein